MYLAKVEIFWHVGTYFWSSIFVFQFLCLPEVQSCYFKHVLWQWNHTLYKFPALAGTRMSVFSHLDPFSHVIFSSINNKRCILLKSHLDLIFCEMLVVKIDIFVICQYTWIMHHNVCPMLTVLRHNLCIGDYQNGLSRNAFWTWLHLLFFAVIDKTGSQILLFTFLDFKNAGRKQCNNFIKQYQTKA